LHGKDDAARRLALTNYHRARIEAITAAWVADTGKSGGKIPDSLLARTDKKSPSAIVVAPAAVTKSITEVSILGAITRGTEALGKVTDEEGWKKIAALHADDAMLDSRSQTLIRRQTESLFATLAAPRATDAQLAGLIRNFQSLLALDSVRNEYVLHTKLHAWLMLGQNADDVNALNERVYAELFLTPRSDPWLGLLSSDVYTALEGGGISRY
jgi:hypothetical protein